MNKPLCLVWKLLLVLRPGHYSRLHGLQNFRSENEGSSAAEDGGMTAIIARIKNTLTQPSSPAVAEVRPRKEWMFALVRGVLFSLYYW